jgi:hypothetical protein
MTMLGELYAYAMGVKARLRERRPQWYKLRPPMAGDREGMFALAMLRLGGRGGPRQSARKAVKLLASSASSATRRRP